MNHTASGDIWAAAADLLDIRAAGPELYDEFFARLRDEQSHRSPPPAKTSGPISRTHYARWWGEWDDLNKREMAEAKIVGCDLANVLGMSAQDGLNTVRGVLDMWWTVRLLRDYGERARRKLAAEVEQVSTVVDKTTPAPAIAAPVAPVAIPASLAFLQGGGK